MEKEKEKILLVSGLILLLLVASIGGCTQPAPASSSSSGEKSGKVTNLTFSGGSIGGGSNLSASAWAGVAKKFMGIDSTVIIHVASTAPTSVHDGISDVAVCPPPVDGDAYNGTDTYAGKTPLKDLRILCNFNTSDISMLVPASSSIKSIKDVIGKRVSVGKKGTLADLFFTQFLPLFSVKPEQVNIMYLGHEEAATNMALGKLDASFVVGACPHPTYSQTDLTFPLRLVQLSDGDLNTIIKGVPYLYAQNLPRYYHSEGTTYKALALTQQMLTSVRLSEDITYRLLKNYLENPDYIKLFREDLGNSISSGDIKTSTEAMSWVVPYHAGAMRYFKEVGWKIPVDRTPPELK